MISLRLKFLKVFSKLHTYSNTANKESFFFSINTIKCEAKDLRLSLKVYHTLIYVYLKRKKKSTKIILVSTTLTENQNSYGWFKCSFRFSSMFCYMRLIKVRQRVVCLQTTATTHNICSRAIGRSEKLGVGGEYFVMWWA